MAKILVADDDPVTRKLITSIFEPHAEVIQAVDGEEAMNAFEEAIDTSNPFQFVILDIAMPKADGLDVLAAIRIIEEDRGIVGTSGVKSIIISGHNDTGTIYDAHALDCTAYMIKPVDAHKLLTEAKRLGLVTES